MVKRETNSWRYPLIMAGYLFALAYLASFITYRVVGPGRKVAISQQQCWSRSSSPSRCAVSAWKLMPARRRLRALLALDAWAARHPRWRAGASVR